MVFCQKLNINITACSWHPELAEDGCAQCLAEERRVNSGLRVVAPRGQTDKPKAYCTICRKPVFGNVKTSAEITCGVCVQRSLAQLEEGQSAKVSKIKMRTYHAKQKVRYSGHLTQQRFVGY